jgi:hypothetical protein
MLSALESASEIVGFVVAVVAAAVKVQLRGIDTMWRRSCSLRLGQSVVCFVVLVVVAGLATGSVLVHLNLRRRRFVG